MSPWNEEFRLNSYGTVMERLTQASLTPARSVEPRASHSDPLQGAQPHAHQTLADAPGHHQLPGMQATADPTVSVSGRAGTGTVLMLGYMNREALVATLALRRVVFFSRSKQRLWEKGETSGNALEVEQIHRDCDGDTLLVSAWPRGPVCHSGIGSCFGDPIAETGKATNYLETLEEVIRQCLEVRVPGSYTARLLDAGWQRMAQKVGEEGIEVALAATGGSDHEVISEVADLFYHVLVLLKARGLSLERVLKELESRHVVHGAPAGSGAR
jgi:phosphoribosyl-AMP cyclohydrolase / phosphoribosyl-ATP pyrophosphohydrolase